MPRKLVTKKFRNVRTQLRAFGREWLRTSKQYTDGPVLMQRSGRLHESLAIEDRTDEDPPEISVTAEALNPKTGFPYATYHEFISGRSYIRSAQHFVMSKWFANRAGGSIIARAAVRDSMELFEDGLVERGWQLAADLSGPGILTRTAFRTLRIDVSGGAGTFVTTAQQGIFF